MAIIFSQVLCLSCSVTWSGVSAYGAAVGAGATAPHPRGGFRRVAGGPGDVLGDLPVRVEGLWQALDPAHLIHHSVGRGAVDIPLFVAVGQRCVGRGAMAVIGGKKRFGGRLMGLDADLHAAMERFADVGRRDMNGPGDGHVPQAGFHGRLVSDGVGECGSS